MNQIQVPFFTMKNLPESIKNEWERAVASVIKGGVFINGPQVSEFENAWANYVGTQYAIGVGNGLDGLTLGLKSLGVGNGEIVAVPSHTFIASWLAVVEAGGIPVGVDVDENGLLDLDSLFALSERPHTVMPVHMHGSMVDMEKLMNWAARFNVKIIEDSSQAHGAVFKGKKAGSWGDVGVFSLYPTKNLGALGDAGVVTTNNFEIARSIRQLSNYGSSANNKYLHVKIGKNSRLDSMQAAILSVNLKYLDEWNEQRKFKASVLSDFCRKLNIKLFQETLEMNVFHHFIIRSTKRDELREFLLSFGVATEIHYPFTASSEFKHLTGVDYGTSFNAEAIAKQSLSLPMHPWLGDDEVELIKEALKVAADNGLLHH